MTGLFIVFVGLDCVGKSTHCDLVVKEIYNSILIKYPNRQTSTGKIINEYLTNKTTLNDKAIHLLFSANRWESNDWIQSTLHSGKTIICDRYIHSGLAYSVAKGLDLQWCKTCDDGLIEPDILFYLYTSSESQKDRYGFGDERYEKTDFQDKVKKEFENILPKNVIKINTNKSIEDVHKEIMNEIMKRL